MLLTKWKDPAFKYHPSETHDDARNFHKRMTQDYVQRPRAVGETDHTVATIMPVIRRRGQTRET